MNDDKHLMIASSDQNQIVQLDLTASDAKPQSFPDLLGFLENVYLSYVKELKSLSYELDYDPK